MVNESRTIPGKGHGPEHTLGCPVLATAEIGDGVIKRQGAEGSVCSVNIGMWHCLMCSDS